MGNKKFTFKQLLTEKKVEIPVLQRDYVQGNLKDKKAESIREDFVTDLINHLVKPDPDEMTLDFIYGKIIDDDLNEEQERHEEHLESLLDTVSEYAKKSGFEIQKSFKRLNGFISKDTFVPFDGQQRLTTLFLIHFLVYAKLNKDISILRNFLYKTRESSRDFLETLLNNQMDFKADEVWESSFVNFIQDRNWFYNFWKYDPTVMSMMVMLEEFRITLLKHPDLEVSLERIYINLEKNDVLTFDYLDIEEHNLDDILYVKMNASGKELFDFEKFKSWLIEYVEEPNNKIICDIQDWEDKLDTNWYDLFWEVDKKETDKLIYQFFKKLLMFNYCNKEILVTTKEILTEKEKQDEIEKQVKIRKVIYDSLNSDVTIPFRFYIEHNIINADSLNFIFWNIDFLANASFNSDFELTIRKVWNKTFLEDWKEDETFKKFIISNIGGFNLFHLTFVYSIFSYIEQLNKNSKDFNEEGFFEWIRLIRNLIYNSRIDDPTPFFNAIQSINNFGSNCLNVREALKNENFIDYFPERQRKEEYQKNKENYNSWRDDFINAENHSYFYGQIAFLIQLSKIENEPNQDRFRFLYTQLSEIFNHDNLNANNLISRSLLTINQNWMYDYGSNRRLFCLSKRASSRDRDENWRRIFNDPDKRNILTVLADLYNQQGSLKNIIVERKENINDWRRLFLEYPSELKYCKQGLINCLKNGNYIRLLGQSRISHKHRELRTSILFNRFLKEKFIPQKIKYNEMKSDSNCFISLNINGVELKINFLYTDLKFHFYKVAGNSDEEFSFDELKIIDENLYHSIETMNLYLSN